MHIHNCCDNGEEISRHSARNRFEKDGGGHACRESSECETMCAEISVITVADTVADNGRTSECGSVSNKERVVLVEKEGCATVVVYPERHMAHIFLADGTVVTGNNNGAYQVKYKFMNM